MKNICIPETVGEYYDDLMERAFPDQRVPQNDFYRRLIGWIIDERTPLLYDITDPAERDNLSISHNWLATRDYTGSWMGSEPTVRTLYNLHEFTHMTQRLPTRTGDVSRSEYAEDFARSEYRASNESEILVHYRIPELRLFVFRDVCLAVDLMREYGVKERPSSQLLNQVRALLVEHGDFDHLLGDDPRVQAELRRLKNYGGNREWAARHYDEIHRRFDDSSWPQSSGLTDSEYEEVIGSYEPRLSQAQYELNVIRNVRFAYAMCGLGVPFITTFEQAREAAEGLEGHHALVSN